MFCRAHIPSHHCQVGEANVGGIQVKFWLTAEGFQKLTSLCPCPFWLVKPAADEKKSMFISSLTKITMSFANA